MSSALLVADPAVEEMHSGMGGNSPSVLPEIFREDANFVVWHRKLCSSIEQAAKQVVEDKPNLQLSVAVTTKSAASHVSKALGSSDPSNALSEDIAVLVDMYSCLFELKHVGLRLSTLDHAMCSRFHVDIVPCRLLTTYRGIATEWLPNPLIDRSKLGRGNQGKPDAESGLYKKQESIQRLVEGEVALLKGEHWQGNEGAGLVHRSPAMENGTSRLLLTLDSIED